MGRFSAGVFGAGLGVAGGVALGALILAPAAGIVGGPDGSAGGDREVRREAEAERARADAADDVLAAHEDELVADKLKGVPVLVVVADGADPAAADALRRTLGAAGAADAGRVTLSGDFTSAEGADRLGDLVAGVLPAGVELDEARTTPGRHVGQALAPALLLGEDGQPRVDAGQRELVLSTLRDEGYLDWEQGTLRPAAAVAIVSGPAGDGFAASVLAEFAAALSEGPGGAVLAAPAEADGGALAALDDVPGADRVGRASGIADAAGRIAAVTALADVAGRPAAPAPEGEGGDAAPSESADPAAPDTPEGEGAEPADPAAPADGADPAAPAGDRPTQAGSTQTAPPA
ncbi:copper transporter [Corynebacterium sp. 335C]